MFCKLRQINIKPAITGTLNRLGISQSLRFIQMSNRQILDQLAKDTDNNKSLSSLVKEINQFKSDSLESMDAVIRHFGANSIKGELYSDIMVFYAEHEYKSQILVEKKAIEDIFANATGFKSVKSYAKGMASALDKKLTVSDFKALNYFKFGIENGYKFNESSVLALVRSIGSRGNKSEIEELTNLVTKNQAVLTPQIYNELIIAIGNTGDVYGAQLYFEQFQRVNSVQLPFVYVTFAKVLARNNKIADGLDILLRLMPAAGMPLKTPSINEYLETLLYMGHLEDAEEIFEMMFDANPICRPDIGTIDLGVILYSLKNDYSKASELFKRKKNSGMVWSSRSLSFGQFGLLAMKQKDFDVGLKILQGDGSYLPLFLECCKYEFKTNAERLTMIKASMNSTKRAFKMDWARNYIQQCIRSCIELATDWPSIKEIIDAFSLVSPDRNNIRGIWSKFESFKKDPTQLGLITLSDFEQLFVFACQSLPAVYQPQDISARVFQLHKLMVEFNLQPNSNIYRIVFGYLKSHRDFVGLAKWQHLMIEKNYLPASKLGKIQQMSLTSLCGNIEMYCELGDLEKGLAAFKCIEEKNMFLFKSTFKALAKCIREKGQPNQLIDLINSTWETTTRLSDNPMAMGLHSEACFEAMNHSFRTNNRQLLAGSTMMYMTVHSKVPRNFDRIVKYLGNIRNEDAASKIIPQLNSKRKELEPNWNP